MPSASASAVPSPGRQVAQTRPLAASVSATLAYWLYLPPGYAEQAERRWPLLFFLHDPGERATDLQQVKQKGPPRFIESRPDLPFILVSPQVPAGGAWDPLLLHALLAQLQREWRIDADRASVTGLSMGGRGAWAWAIEFPQDLAAIAPICGEGDEDRMARIRHLPVWAFHGEADSVVPFELQRRDIEARRAAGGEPRFTTYPGVGHDAWTPAYTDPALFDWLLAQRWAVDPGPAPRPRSAARALRPFGPGNLDPIAPRLLQGSLAIDLAPVGALDARQAVQVEPGHGGVQGGHSEAAGLHLHCGHRRFRDAYEGKL